MMVSDTNLMVLGRNNFQVCNSQVLGTTLTALDSSVRGMNSLAMGNFPECSSSELCNCRQECSRQVCNNRQECNNLALSSYLVCSKLESCSLILLAVLDRLV